MRNVVNEAPLADARSIANRLRGASRFTRGGVQINHLYTKKAGHADRVVDMLRLMDGCDGSVPTAEGAIDHVVEIGVVTRLGVAAHSRGDD